MAANFTVFEPFRLLSVGLLEGYGLQKNPYTIPDLLTAIQSETEAIYTEILAKVLNIFSLFVQSSLS
jgi:hypothetical protein